MKMTKHFWVCALAVLFGLTSCISESLNSIAPCGEEVTMTLSTNIQRTADAQSRALSHEDEQKLHTAVKVLAFDGSDKYLYEKDGIVSDNAPEGTNGGGKATIKFTAPISTANVTFVVIANANDEVTAALTDVGATPGTTTKAQILGNSKLVKVLTAGTAWNATSGILIPMHGETDPAPVTDAATVNVTLRRMLARINVSATGILAANFQLTSVRLYNTNHGGYIAPGNTPLAAWSYLKASGHLLYNTGITDNVLKNTIYTFERSGVTSASPVILVVGGRFNGSGTETFYKVVFTEGSSSYKDLLRNNSYNVEISSVLNEGHPTPEEAYNSTSENVTADILAWDDTNIGGIVFDGVYTLSVTPANFNLDADASTGTITIKTDWTEKPDISISSSEATITPPSPAWLTMVSYPEVSGSGLKTYTYTFNVEANINNDAARTNYIHIQAGRLTYVVKVQQRLKITQREANSYIIPKGWKTPILIPISQVTKGYNAAGVSIPGGPVSSTNYSVSVLWSEMGVAGTSTIIEPDVFVEAAGDYISVQAGDIEGNFVVEMKNSSGVHLWSWHIWVTDGYYPYKTTVGLPNSNDGDANGDGVLNINESNNANKWIHYNLGAFNAKADRSQTAMGEGGFSSLIFDTRGLYYQWGRKDPLPMLNDPIIEVDYLISAALVLSSPRTYSRWEDYYGTLPEAGVNNDSWDLSGSNKSAFDPCPPGYRIPTMATAAAASASGTWTEVTRGRSNPNIGGYYPYSGYRYPAITYPLMGGSVWLATPFDGIVAYHHGAVGGILTTGGRSAGYNVRCVAE